MHKVEIDIGKKFPDTYNKIRIENEIKWEKMLLSEHIYQYTLSAKEGRLNQNPVDPFVPIPALVSEIHSDLLFGEFPKIEGSNDAQTNIITEYIKSNQKIKTNYLESAAYCSAMGHVFHCVYKVNDKVYDKFIKSSQVMWEQDDLGLTKVVIFNTVKVDKVGKTITYAIQEYYFDYDEKLPSPLYDDSRKLVISEYEIIVDTSVNTRIKSIGKKETKNTDWDFMPIKKIDNIRIMGSSCGKSDYQGKEQLFAEIDARIDQINYALQENQEPWLVVPPGVLDEHGNFNRRNGKMIQKSSYEGDNEIGITSWDPQLEGAFKQIETMIEMVFFTSRISAPIAGIDKGGQVESGRALRWKSINTFSMINRKRNYWEEDIKWYFETLGKMGAFEGVIEQKDIIIYWQDGLPMDSQEIIDNVIRQVNAGLMSKVSAIAEINETDDKTASQELEQVNSEKQTQADIDSTRFKVQVE